MCVCVCVCTQQLDPSIDIKHVQEELPIYAVGSLTLDALRSVLRHLGAEEGGKSVIYISDIREVCVCVCLRAIITDHTDRGLARVWVCGCVCARGDVQRLVCVEGLVCVSAAAAVRTAWLGLLCVMLSDM